MPVQLFDTSTLRVPWEIVTEAIPFWLWSTIQIMSPGRIILEERELLLSREEVPLPNLGFLP